MKKNNMKLNVQIVQVMQTINRFQASVEYSL